MSNFIDEEEKELSPLTLRINRTCKNFRFIFHNNYTLITFSFIIFYFAEQIALIYFSYKISPEVSVGIGLFVLIMMTTIGIERLLMESKNNKLTEYCNNLRTRNTMIFNEYLIKKRLKK